MRNKYDEYVIAMFTQIMRERDVHCDFDALVKMRVIYFAAVRSIVVRHLYHTYKSEGQTAQVSVWRISDEVGMSDANIWRIIKSKS